MPASKFKTNKQTLKISVENHEKQLPINDAQTSLANKYYLLLSTRLGHPTFVMLNLDAETLDLNSHTRTTQHPLQVYNIFCFLQGYKGNIQLLQC